MLFFHLFTAGAASVPATWELDENASHRWVVQSDIALPGFMWLYADRNRDVRARAVGMQMVTTCRGEPLTHGVGLLTCLVEDISFTGSTFTSEQGRMQPVLDEMDVKMTGGSFTLLMKPNGRIRTVKLDLNPEYSGPKNRRTRQMSETLRLLVVRATAAFDLTIPKGGFPDGGWPQFESHLLQLPSVKGTAGAGKLVHTAGALNVRQVAVSTLGHATLVDGASFDQGAARYLDTTIAGYTIFDTRAGRISEATWETVGEPTASSGLIQTIYAARSTLRALTPDEEVILDETREWTPNYNGTGVLFPGDGSADSE